MLQLPHHQDLNMPPNFPMSNDSGFHETGKKKTLQIELKYVRFSLFSYLIYIHMTLNVIGSFDVKKSNTHQTFD